MESTFRVSEQDSSTALIQYSIARSFGPAHGAGHLSTCFRALSLTTPLSVQNTELQRILEFMQKQPLGLKIDYQHDPPSQLGLTVLGHTKTLRQICFPNHSFGKCAVFKGCPQSMLQTHSTVTEGEGCVIMWKNSDIKSVQISSVQWANFWRMILTRQIGL